MSLFFLCGSLLRGCGLLYRELLLHNALGNRSIAKHCILHLDILFSHTAKICIIKSDLRLKIAHSLLCLCSVACVIKGNEDRRVDL